MIRLRLMSSKLLNQMIVKPCVMVEAISVSDVISVVEDEFEIGVWVPDTSELFETTSKSRSAWLPPKLKRGEMKAILFLKRLFKFCHNMD